MGNNVLLVDVKEAARQLSLAPSTLYTLVLTGEIASIKIGRSRRVLVSSLIAFIDNKVREQGA